MFQVGSLTNRKRLLSMLLEHSTKVQGLSERKNDMHSTYSGIAHDCCVAATSSLPYISPVA